MVRGNDDISKQLLYSMYNFDWKRSRSEGKVPKAVRNRIKKQLQVCFLYSLQHESLNKGATDVIATTSGI